MSPWMAGRLQSRPHWPWPGFPQLPELVVQVVGGGQGMGNYQADEMALFFPPAKLLGFPPSNSLHSREYSVSRENPI